MGREVRLNSQHHNRGQYDRSVRSDVGSQEAAETASRLRKDGAERIRSKQGFQC